MSTTSTTDPGVVGKRTVDLLLEGLHDHGRGAEEIEEAEAVEIVHEAGKRHEVGVGRAGAQTCAGHGVNGAMQ